MNSNGNSNRRGGVGCLVCGRTTQVRSREEDKGDVGVAGKADDTARMLCVAFVQVEPIQPPHLACMQWHSDGKT